MAVGQCRGRREAREAQPGGADDGLWSQGPAGRTPRRAEKIGLDEARLAWPAVAPIQPRQFCRDRAAFEGARHRRVARMPVARASPLAGRSLPTPATVARSGAHLEKRECPAIDPASPVSIGRAGTRRRAGSAPTSDGSSRHAGSRGASRPHGLRRSRR
jgi:hypothetical protein